MSSIKTHGPQQLVAKAPHAGVPPWAWTRTPAFLYKRGMPAIAIAVWVLRGLARRPIAWLVAGLSAGVAPLSEALAPHGIVQERASSSTAFEVAFLSGVAGAWLALTILHQGEPWLRSRGAWASTLLWGWGVAVGSCAMALPAWLGATLAHDSPAGPQTAALLATLFHLAGLALVVERLIPSHRGIALFAASWVLPVLLLADRGQAGIVTAIPSALAPSWPGSIASGGALISLLAGAALWGAAGLLHRPRRRPPR